MTHVLDIDTVAVEKNVGSCTAALVVTTFFHEAGFRELSLAIIMWEEAVGGSVTALQKLWMKV